MVVVGPRDGGSLAERWWDIVGDEVRTKMIWGENRWWSSLGMKRRGGQFFPFSISTTGEGSLLKAATGKIERNVFWSTFYSRRYGVIGRRKITCQMLWGRLTLQSIASMDTTEGCEILCVHNKSHDQHMRLIGKNNERAIFQVVRRCFSSLDIKAN